MDFSEQINVHIIVLSEHFPSGSEVSLVWF